MFERYTEKARRTIFFARYEASQYGSSFIDTEHILLGLLRDDHELVERLAGLTDSRTQIRTDVEKAIKKQGKPYPTSVDVPLSADSKRLLKFAVEEADRLGQQHVGTEHILLALLRLKDSLAAKVLVARGAKVAAIREKVGKRSALVAPSMQPAREALLVLDEFLGALRGGGSERAAAFFDERGQFIDSSGKRWIGRKEIDGAAEALFARFAKRNVKFALEDTVNGPSETVVASVLWEFAAVSGDHSESMLRMSIVLASAGEEWTIVLAQVTPVLPELEPNR
ncbi:MAG: Clp protease N-terminal domain-containing protein [Candidatus Acidiferrales bacterium]